jgi:hypothetical protein
MSKSSAAGERSTGSVIELSHYRAQGRTAPTPCATPTLFVDFDGTFHIGRASMSEDGTISLNTGRPLFEFAPLLIELLEPYASVQLVLTTSWLMTLSPEDVVAAMPHELALRVAGTTHRIKPRLNDVLNGTHRACVINCYAQTMKLQHWLAIDEDAIGASRFEGTHDLFVGHFLSANPALGLSDVHARRRIEDWLVNLSTISHEGETHG